MSERKQRPSHTEQKDRQPLPDLPRSERKPHPFFRRHTDPPKPRSSPSSRPPPPVDPATAGPWQHMANTYAWVVEQEFVQVDRRNRTTEQWIFEQKIRFPDPQERRDIEERVRRRMWEEAMNDYEVEAEEWMRHEEELRHMAVERAKQKVEALEELRRYEARMREKRNAGKRRGVWEDRYGAQQAATARKCEHVKAIVEGWEKYEKRWASLSASSEPLAFTDIPWPLQTAPIRPGDITRKERIRAAQLRFHPDRAGPRIMRRVKEENKDLVADGIGIVARCLNDMMAREKRP